MNLYMENRSEAGLVLLPKLKHRTCTFNKLLKDESRSRYPSKEIHVKKTIIAIIILLLLCLLGPK